MIDDQSTGQGGTRTFLRREDGYEVWQESGMIGFQAKVLEDADDPQDPYDLAEVVNQSGAQPYTIEVCYTSAGHYIGDESHAKHLTQKLGIAPELRPGTTVCSIGFCKKEHKWYGWSHRALFGFGVGSEVKKGDCAYVPRNEEEAIEDSIRFWTDEDHLDVHGYIEMHDGQRMIHVTWQLSYFIPNEKLRGTIADSFSSLPEEYGRGEWTATTLDEAKQMAIDFADGVS